MAKCTQNSEKTLENEVIDAILENVNIALCFYRNRPSTAMKLSVEETIIDNLPFAKIVAKKSERGARLLEKLEQLNSQVIGFLSFDELELA